MEYDLIVIGGGPGGYVAAIRGAQRGLKVALVERSEALGGTCLHRGCIPSKALLAAAESIDRARKAERMGIAFGEPRVDYPKLVGRKGESVRTLGRGVSSLLKSHEVEVIGGAATLTQPHSVRVGEAQYNARFVILATGTEPIRPAEFPFDGHRVVTTDELFDLETLPGKVLIIGGGVIGCEMACAFNLLGSEVHLSEILPEILAGEGKVVSRTLRRVFEKRGMLLTLGRRLASIDPSYDLVLVAVGRRPRLNGLGVERLNLKRSPEGFVEVNERMETSVEGLYAVGDVVGKTMLAHGAMAEGICAVEAIVGSLAPIDYNTVPRVTYTLPEVASIGRGEEELGGVEHRTGRFSYQANGMALIHEEEEGFAEVRATPQGKILGATILGAHAADMIGEIGLAMRHDLPVSSLSFTIHPHPSLSEVVHEAAGDCEGLAIHKAGRPVR